MSSYTIRLQRLLNSGFEIWDRERPFPIFNEAHRNELEKMIEDHYYMQEIGYEVPMTFKHFLNSRMREIMPKYNAMFESASSFISEDDFFTFKERGSSNGSNTNNSASSQVGNSHTTVNSTQTPDTTVTTKNGIETRQYNYDTPMNMTTQSTDDGHMSSATINKADGERNKTDVTTRGTITNSSGTTTDNSLNSSANDTGSHSENYDKVVNGQSPYKTIEEYRALIFDIDRMIIEELADLFMMVF